MLASLIGALAGWFLKKHIKKKQYREEYLALEQERDELNKRMSQAEEAMDRRYYLMTSENQKVHDELNKSNSDNVILSKKIQSISSEFDKSKTELIALREELTSTRKEIGELQGMNEQRWTEQSLCKPNTSELKNQSERVTQTCTDEKICNTENDSDTQSLQHKIAALNTQNAHLKARVAEFTQKRLDVTNITSQLNRANSERERLLSNQTLNNQETDQIEKLRSELINSQTLLAKKETELAHHKSYLIDEEKKLIAEVESSPVRLASSEQLSAELQNNYSASIETIEILEADLAKLSAANRELQTQLANNETEYAALKQDYNKQKHQIEQLSSQVRKLMGKSDDK
ncbi:MAG: Unknown protein [uncultured Thiotrichaceae bacterium]|uniref:Uncharacterized protein n=1 Tax=uncultured Thiotrichaceae bacterium TaxID=298394 RepID=A0A6S6RUA4_9GAMM|nr:MAG: Unknown protein [uncultured Thiotrichaceae bacterium]